MIPKDPARQQAARDRLQQHRNDEEERTNHSERANLSEWLVSRFGSKWVVAARLTPRLKAKGYTVALSERRFRALEAEFKAEGGR